MPRYSKIPLQEIEKLIELVRDNPCLYDQRCGQYRDCGLQKIVWTSISYAMGHPDMTGEDWKKEWRYRRDVYVKKRRQMREKKSGQQAAKQPKDWELYQTMAFLDQFVESNNTESSLSALPSDEESNASSVDDTATIGCCTVHFQDNGRTVGSSKRPMSPSSVSSASSTSRYQPVATKKSKHDQKPGRQIEHALSELIKDRQETRHQVLASASENRPRTAEQSFFDHCAARMETMPGHIKSCLQIQITQLFHNAENPTAPPLPIMPLPVQLSEPLTVHSENPNAQTLRHLLSKSNM